MAPSIEQVLQHAVSTLNLLDGQGFTVNYLNSVLVPSQKMEFLGSLVNSFDLSLSIPRDRIRKIQSKSQDLLNTPVTTVRELSKFLGLLSSSIQAVLPAPLHYRYLQQAKNSVIRFRKSYEGVVHLDSECHQDVQWWKYNLVAWNGKALFQQSTYLVIETDASRQGWGAYCQGMSTGGRYLPEETLYHINCLELLAGWLAIMSFTKNKAKAQLLLLMDNISAVTYINKMGGTHSPSLSYLAKKSVGLVSHPQYLGDSVIHPRSRECRSGQRIEIISRFQWLETVSSGFQPPPSRVGCPEHRPVWLPSLLPTRSVCKLASRPSIKSHRCIHSGLGVLSGLRLSSIYSDRPMPSPNSESAGVTHGVCSTSLASSALVSTTIKPVHRLPSLLPFQEDLLTQGSRTHPVWNFTKSDYWINVLKFASF